MTELHGLSEMNKKEKRESKQKPPKIQNLG